MKNFRLLMTLALAFCFSQATFAQSECDQMMQRQVSNLQESAADMTPEEGQRALTRIMRSYNKCMGHDFGEGQERRKKKYGRKGSNEDYRRGTIETISAPARKPVQPETRYVPQQRPSQESYNPPVLRETQPETSDERYQKPTQTRKQLEEQRKIEDAARQGQNPEAAKENQEQLKDYCMRRTAKQRAAIMKERDIAVNKISSAVQRRKIFAETDQKIRSLLLNCMQNNQGLD